MTSIAGIQHHNCGGDTSAIFPEDDVPILALDGDDLHVIRQHRHHLEPKHRGFADDKAQVDLFSFCRSDTYRLS